MFEGFANLFIDANGARIRVRHGGKGPPLLLLHGNPQTHMCWHKIADRLAEHFHVVATDLRGYGDSSAPEPDERCTNYSFRTMAQDQVEVMQALGYERFFAAGHDRGARTLHRMMLDHSECVLKGALLDILPSRHIWRNVSREWALKSWHWVFMAQTGGLPESMIESVPAEWFLDRKMSKPGIGRSIFAPEAWAEYVRCFTPKTIKGSCADYRAGATVDLEMDEADFDRKVTAPLLVIWGVKSHTEAVFDDVLGVWRDYASNVTGGPVISGHYVPEHAPDETFAKFMDFLAPDDQRDDDDNHRMRSAMSIKSGLAVAVMTAIMIMPALQQPASAQSVPPGYPDGYKAIVAAAMKEGKVTILSSTNSPNTKPVWADFEKLYPGITVEQSDLSSTELYNRFLSQDAAGAHVTDVLWSNAMDLQMKLVMDGKAMTYVSPEKSHMPDWAQYNDQIYALTLDPTVFVYNKRLLPAALVPKTHADILKLMTDHRDQFQGKVTTYDVASTGSAYLTAVFDSQHWPQYWDLVNALGKVGARYYQSAGAMVEMVAAGQYAFAYDLPYPYAQFREMTDPNVGHVFPSDYTLSLSRLVLISKNSPHPNAAKLFLDYLLSKRGQQLIADKGALVSIRPDVTGVNSFAEVSKQAGPNLVPVKIDPSLLDSLQPRKRLDFLRKWKSGAHGG